MQARLRQVRSERAGKAGEEKPAAEAESLLAQTEQELNVALTQIKQIVRALSETWGQPIAVPDGYAPMFGFPAPEALAQVSETELRKWFADFYTIEFDNYQVAAEYLDHPELVATPVPRHG